MDEAGFFNHRQNGGRKVRKGWGWIFLNRR